MNRENVTNRQVFFLIFLFLLGNLVNANGAKSLRDSWLIYLILGFLSVPVSLLFVKACRQRCAGEIFVSAFGPKAGGVVTALYAVLAVMLAGDDIRQFADFIVINDLNDAGAWGNSAMLTLVILLLLLCSLHSLGKTAWCILPLTVALLLLSLAMTVPKMNFHRLLPVFEESSELLLGGAVSGATNVLAFSFFPIATLGYSAPEGWKKSVWVAEACACFLLAMLSLRTAAVLGFPAMSMFRFPSFVAANAVQHSEVLISTAFVFCQPFRAALLLRYVQECLVYWAPRWKRWYPIGLVVLAVASAAFSWSSQHQRWRTAAESVVTGFLLLGPAAVVVIDLVREKRSNRQKA